MKTTLEIHDEWRVRAKALSARGHESLTVLIEEGLPPGHRVTFDRGFRGWLRHSEPTLLEPAWSAGTPVPAVADGLPWNEPMSYNFAPWPRQ